MLPLLEEEGGGVAWYFDTFLDASGEVARVFRYFNAFLFVRHREARDITAGIVHTYYEIAGHRVSLLYRRQMSNWHAVYLLQYLYPISFSIRKSRGRLTAVIVSPLKRSTGRGLRLAYTRVTEQSWLTASAHRAARSRRVSSELPFGPALVRA